METLSAILALCEGNPSVTVDSSSHDANDAEQTVQLPDLRRHDAYQTPL